MKIAIAALTLMFLLVGCASPNGHYRLEVYGEGWALDVEDDNGEGLRAKWKAGDNRTTKFVNMDDRGGGYAVSMLYLELEKDGNVKNGL
ncbi:hypothetical protein OAU50_07945, partial [Planctomycetota bacterium]|nr:hypothetical protein [Planctomycetota bacterium]